MEHNDLGESLRSLRDRLAPADVGLPEQGRRRAPGLRREELAQLAGVSADYLTRLEQGRASNPSREVLSALARALRLSADEQAHLFRQAGQLPEGHGRMARHMTPSLQRIVDRLGDVPVLVVDAAWTIVTCNPMAAALLGDPTSATGRGRNVLWNHFTGVPSRIEHTGEDAERFQREVVADLHAALGRYPEDETLRALVADLRQASPRFEELWRTRPAAEHTAARKVIVHPEVGRLTVDCDVLTVGGTDLRLVVYSAPPGSPDADALALVGVVGLQQLP